MLVITLAVMLVFKSFVQKIIDNLKYKILASINLIII